jgi:hypothetical protein
MKTQALIHPGIINYSETLGEIGTIDVTNLPDSEKFVFFKNGTVVDSSGEFDTAVPILERETVYFDEAGVVTSNQSAVRRHTTDYGPQHQKLREFDAHMIKGK